MTHMETSSSPAPATSAGHHGKVIGILITVIVVAVAAYYWSTYSGPNNDEQSNNTPAPVAGAESRTGDTSAVTGLGGELFEKSSNPVGGALPDAAPPVPNPLESLYQNPFE